MKTTSLFEEFSPFFLPVTLSKVHISFNDKELARASLKLLTLNYENIIVILVLCNEDNFLASSCNLTSV